MNQTDNNLQVQIHFMNSSVDLGSVGQDGVQYKSIITEKKFEFNLIKWVYENNFNLSLTDNSLLSTLKIKNHLCEMHGTEITKVIEITYQDKIYKIEDTYNLNIEHLNNSEKMQDEKSKDSGNTNSTNNSDDKNDDNKDDPNDKKVYIFKNINRKSKQKHQDQKDNRNTKNIAKNFCKAFILYLRSQKVTNFSRKQIKEAIKSYNDISQEGKFNNAVIKNIINNKELAALFKEFLNQEARQWINYSRISDKALHQDAIQIFLKLYDEEPPESAESNIDSAQ